MRISDWSSDVCSSDLSNVKIGPAIDHRRVRSGHVGPARRTIGARPQLRVRADRNELVAARHAVTRLHRQLDLARCADRHRSEEHTSELQSLMRISYAVFCLNKKKYTIYHIKYI